MGLDDIYGAIDRTSFDDTGARLKPARYGLMLGFRSILERVRRKKSHGLDIDLAGVLGPPGAAVCVLGRAISLFLRIRELNRFLGAIDNNPGIGGARIVIPRNKATQALPRKVGIDAIALQELVAIPELGRRNLVEHIESLGSVVLYGSRGLIHEVRSIRVERVENIR